MWHPMHRFPIYLIVSLLLAVMCALLFLSLHALLHLECCFF